MFDEEKVREDTLKAVDLARDRLEKIEAAAGKGDYRACAAHWQSIQLGAYFLMTGSQNAAAEKSKLN